MSLLQTFHALRTGDRAKALALLEPMLPMARESAEFGGTLFGLSALLADGEEGRDKAVDDGMVRLGRGALSHTVIWFHACVLERAVIDADRALARRHIDALRDYTAEESLGFVTLHTRTVELALWRSTAAARKAHAAALADAGLHAVAGLLDIA